MGKTYIRKSPWIEAIKSPDRKSPMSAHHSKRLKIQLKYTVLKSQDTWEIDWILRTIKMVSFLNSNITSWKTTKQFPQNSKEIYFWPWILYPNDQAWDWNKNTLRHARLSIFFFLKRLLENAPGKQRCKPGKRMTWDSGNRGSNSRKQSRGRAGKRVEYNA